MKYDESSNVYAVHWNWLPDSMVLKAASAVSFTQEIIQRSNCMALGQNALLVPKLYSWETDIALEKKVIKDIIKKN